MAFQCRLYKNSGFNSNNIPDSPDLLNAGAISYTDVTALDIMQGGALGEIRVRTDWKTAREVDFIRLYDSVNNETWYYSAVPAYMAATDIAVFSVAIDWILSIGGINSLQILDGITNRVHVSDDSYGLYSAEDSLLTPSEPLQLEMEKMGYDDPTSDGYTYNIFIESTVNPLVTEKALQSGTFTYTDSSGNEYNVSVPLIVHNEKYTVYYIGELESTAIVGTCIYNTGSKSGLADAMSEALATLRSLGLEQAVIKQVALPTSFVVATSETAESAYTWSEKSSATQAGQAISFAYISKLTGKQQDKTAPDNDAFKFTYFSSRDAIKNNRINYSNFTKYGLIATSGESLECSPEDLYNTGLTAPAVRCIADPHLDGKPYFRFQQINKDASVSGFWRNCIAGLKWKEVPLIYERASGSLLNTMKFQNSVAVQSIAQNWNQAANVANGISGFLQDITGALGYKEFPESANNVKNIAINPANIMSGISSGVHSTVDYVKSAQMYQARRKSELSDLVIANQVVAPTVNFPFNTDVLRDTYGNDVYMYRYVYSKNDTARIDKLLTMYGYKFAKPLELSDFTNRKYFNFIQCNNVSVTGNPQWVNNGIAEELRTGIRVWHVLPNTDYYTDNPIKESA